MKTFILYILAMAPAASSFVRLSQQNVLKVALHSASSDTDAAVEVTWEMREAHNGDRDLMLEFLRRMRSFNTVIAGTTPNPHLFKEGSTIQSLMPQVPNCHVIFAQDNSNADGGGTAVDPIGFASYHLKYKGFGQPLMHMEHLFVDSTCRSKGAGLALMNKLALIGQKHKCSHVEWSVDELNVGGVRFYERIGAKPSDKTEGTTNTMKWIPAVWSA